MEGQKMRRQAMIERRKLALQTAEEKARLARAKREECKRVAQEIENADEEVRNAKKNLLNIETPEEFKQLHKLYPNGGKRNKTRRVKKRTAI